MITPICKLIMDSIGIMNVTSGSRKWSLWPSCWK